MSTTVLLTGAFANIGRGTQKKVLAAGHQVVCLDRKTRHTQKNMSWKYYLIRLISPLAKRTLLKSSAYF